MTYKLEEPWSDVGLLERILAYEEQAVRVLTRQVQAVPGLHTLPGISLETRLCQTKSRWNGPSVLIRLAEQKRCPGAISAPLSWMSSFRANSRRKPALMES